MVPQLIKGWPLLASVVSQKYPFFFVDESQDTFPEVVEALRTVARQMKGKFCLGFFGDPMQQIYMTGVGEILLDESWKKITKPENFRCPTTVLSVINNIRSQGDGLAQTRGRQLENGQAVAGTAKLFVLPADECRLQNFDRVRRWLAESCSDPHWTYDSREADVRILVIAHRMAAVRLGFPDLFAAFNDGAPESFSTGFREGTLWALKPFLDVLLPLTSALDQNRQIEVMKLLRIHCPRLDTERLRSLNNSSELLNSLKLNMLELTALMSPSSNASVLEVLQFADRVRLLKLDERLKEYTDPSRIELSENRLRPLASDQEEEKKEEEEEDKAASAIAAYLACPAKQLRDYYTYINDQSPYSTQQGIKGAEFERVIVVLDDEEGRHFQFSYDKFLGLKEPSKTDLDNLNQNKETVLDRTRRLFYVCCSRATKDLAVVLYSDDVTRATTMLKASALFQPEEIYTLDHISEV